MLWLLWMACSGEPAAQASGTVTDTLVDCSTAVGAPLVDLHDGEVSATYGAMFVDDGELVAVFESASPDFTASALWSARSADGLAWDAPEPLEGPDLPFVGGPTLATVDGRPWIYTVGSTDVWGAAQVHRTDPQTGTVEPVDLPGTESVLDWPYVHADGFDDVWLATLESGRRVVARSGDGLAFEVDRKSVV